MQLHPRPNKEPPLDDGRGKVDAKIKPILNLSSQVPSTASLATVRSPAPDAGTINEQVFFSFNFSLAQRGILFRGNHCGGQTPQSILLNKTLDWILKNVFVRYSG